MTYKSGYRYVTTEPVEYSVWPWAGGLECAVENFIVLRDCVLMISTHYAWDGASFILFKWFGTPDAFKKPSLIHDALYQAMREGVLPVEYRRDADALFYTMLRERGVSWIVATVAYYAVRIGGDYAMRHGAGERYVA